MSVVRDIEFTQIAADWDSITLGEEEPQALLVMRNGLATKQVQDNGEYKVSRIETIRDGWIDDTRVRFVSGLEEKDVGKYLLQKGDILFSHINSDRHLGKTGFADRDYDDLLHGMNLLLIRANPEVFDPEFLNRVFQYYRDIGVFIAICSRAVNQSSINQAKMKALELPLPPLPEQKKIAHILSTVQRAIEAQERIIQTTTELKKTLMHKLFTEGTRGEPQKQTEIGLLPESWDLVRCKDVCDTISVGIVVKPSSYYVPDGVPAFRSQNVREDRIQAEPMVYISQEANNGPVKKSKLSAGDVLIVRTGYPGTSCVVPPEFDGSNCIDLIFVRPNEAKLRSHYLSRFFNSDAANIQVQAGKIGLAQQHFNVGAVKNTQMPLPPKNQQDEIVAHLELIDSKQDIASSKRNALQDLFRTLLHELMTAGIRVHDLVLPSTGGHVA